MTDPTPGPAVDQADTQPSTRPDVPRPSLLRVLRDQRKIIGVGVAMMVACYWVLGQLGEWETATLTAAGVGLGLVNQVATELWLAKVISSGDEPTRGRIAASTITRLVLLSAVAVTVAVLYWPSGVGLLLGLALFRLIALVMTGIPLLKELKKA
ncbi:MAG: hypothetical protein HOQ45_09885 [Nocardioidaceae bacterium]|nr:hypothetical protein [Nocardioidaceae bacterium]